MEMDIESINLCSFVSGGEETVEVVGIAVLSRKHFLLLLSYR